MVSHPSHHREQWTRQQEQELRALARGNTPTGLIAWQLGRTEGAVYQHASELGVTLKPTNQSPYNRQKP